MEFYRIIYVCGGTGWLHFFARYLANEICMRNLMVVSFLYHFMVYWSPGELSQTKTKEVTCQIQRIYG